MSKYIVYENDLKYKKNRNLVKNKIIYDDKRLEYYIDNIDMDTIEYRIEESKKNNYLYLDLTNMDLINFPNLPINIKKQVKYLFINDNELKTIPDLSDFINLKVLDISCNKITKIGKIPDTIIELNCNMNKIEDLPNIKSLKKLDCSYNNIVTLPKYQNINKIICDNNKIKKIENYNTLIYLSCTDNKIVDINNCLNLKYLDCSNNKIIKLEQYHSLQDLICNNNNIHELQNYTELKYLEIFSTNITKIPFMKKIKDILYDNNNDLLISNKYIENYNIQRRIHKNSKIILSFTKK
jgi:Leucine-rich repeat (LRR) protein